MHHSKKLSFFFRKYCYKYVLYHHIYFIVTFMGVIFSWGGKYHKLNVLLQAFRKNLTVHQSDQHTCGYRREGYPCLLPGASFYLKLFSYITFLRTVLVDQKITFGSLEYCFSKDRYFLKEPRKNFLNEQKWYLSVGPHTFTLLREIHHVGNRLSILSLKNDFQ